MPSSRFVRSNFNLYRILFLGRIFLFYANHLRSFVIFFLHFYCLAGCRVLGTLGLGRYIDRSKQYPDLPRLGEEKPMIGPTDPTTGEVKIAFSSRIDFAAEGEIFKFSFTKMWLEYWIFFFSSAGVLFWVGGGAYWVHALPLSVHLNPDPAK